MEHKIEALPNPLIIDGGLSTQLELMGYVLDHHLWTARYVDTHPDVIKDVHKSFLNAGAQCIASASYQATIPGFIADNHTKREAKSLLKRTVEIALEARDEFHAENPTQPKAYVAASIGPYGAFMADGSEYKGHYPISHDLLYDFHEERIAVLSKTNPDFFICETIPSAREAEILAELLLKYNLKGWISFSCQNGTEICEGTEIKHSVEMLNAYPNIFAVGVNCTEPQYISSLIRQIKAHTHKRIVVYPNSGEHYDPAQKQWDGSTSGHQCIDSIPEWIALGADIVGGCCRFDANMIAQIRHKLDLVNS